jgi:putative DNA primase/helicase
VPNDIRSWYQLRMGQAITGDMTPDDRIIIQQGYGGENGKSTIMSAIQMTLGDYYLQVAPRALLGSAESVPTEIKALQGIRFACLEELPEEHFLPTTKIKTLAGTPHIKARGMRKDDDGFYASHSLFLNTNFPPAIAESDGGTWRRLCLVNFPYHYVKTADDIRTEFDRLGDPSIRERLRSGKAQREAVLAWLVEGANRYYVDTEGFRTLPQLVVDTTAAWRLTTDMVLGFADEFLTFDDPESYVLVTELLERFNYWIETNNQHKWSAKTFKVRFGGHEVIAANGVEAVTVRRARLTAHISRPEYKQFDQLPDSASFKVWSGVAFKVAEKV